MKKLSIILLLILTLLLSGCESYKEKHDTDYRCEFTYYGETHNFESAIVESYTYSSRTTWVRLELTNGDVVMFDLTQITMLCSEIDNIE